MQHTDALSLGVQHDEAGACSFFSLVVLLFFNTGISVCVSIVKVFSSLKTDNSGNDALKNVQFFPGGTGKALDNIPDIVSDNLVFDLA